MKFYVWTDGGSRGNPGPAGCGVVIRRGTPDATPCLTLHKFLPRATNNQTEYEALLLALRNLTTTEHDEVIIHMDSELIVKQMLGDYACNNPNIRDLYIEANALLSQMDAYVEFHHVKREFNSEADALANKAMDEAQ